MYELYGRYSYPSTSQCNTKHYIGVAVDPVCAFIEGWADFFAVAALNTDTFSYRTGDSKNLELYKSTGISPSNQLSDEGRVAAAMLDVYDSHNDFGYGNSSYQDANTGRRMSDFFSAMSLLKERPASVCSDGNCLNVTDYASVFSSMLVEDFASWNYNYVFPTTWTGTCSEGTSGCQ